MGEISLKEFLREQDTAKSLAKLSFEQGMSLLEQLVEKVEAGELPLEQAVLSYERGVALLGHLREQISGAEEKLQILQKSSEKSKAKSKKGN